MAWTAPATWSVSELVTASKLNTHVRDNLKYLHGDSGAFTVNDNLTVSPASGAGSIVTNSVAGSGSIYYMDKAGSHIWHVSRAGADDRFAVTESGVADRLRIDLSNNGFVAIGSHAPQGKLHVYDRISGLMKWEYDGVDGTARTIIPNGTGDAPIGVGGLYVVQHSGGTTRAGMVSSLGDGTAAVIPGASQNIYNVGGNTLALSVAADGSVTVQRTAGTGTYKVSLLLHWL